MAWEGSERRSELPSNWQEIRAKVKARAGGRCEWRLKSGARCPRPGTDCDHPDDKWNHDWRVLRWLCPHHHGQKSAREGNAAKRAKKMSARRPPKPHPGERIPR